VKTRVSMTVAILLALASASAWAGQGPQDVRAALSHGAIYTASNAVAGNAVLMFDQLPDGRLVPAGQVATGGTGTGGGLGNQGGLILTGTSAGSLP
jgi:6-phosphogluconolactonase